MGSTTIEQVHKKLEAFIRKYYKGQILNRGFLALAFILIIYLLLSILEHNLYMSSTARQWLFYGFIAFVIILIVGLPGLPLFSMLKLRKRLSKEDAARIIGVYFPEISDKLVNMLQLQDQLKEEAQQSSLILASIDQRAQAIGKFSFREAIHLKQSLKTFWYSLIPLLVIIGIIFINPEMITQPTRRIVNYEQSFQKPIGFDIKIQNDSLATIQYHDFILELKVLGDEIPEEIRIQRDGKEYATKANGKGVYTYTFSKPAQDYPFKIIAGPYSSENYLLKVYPKPQIQNFEISIQYPKHTSLNSETIENTGDLNIPEGSILNWKFITRDVSGIHFLSNNKDTLILANKSNAIHFQKQARESFEYQLIPENKFLRASDTLQFNIQTITDEYPQIRFKKLVDSLDYKFIYFQGVIKDDYGFSNLNFYFQKFNPSTQKKGNWIKEKVGITNKQLEENFFHQINLRKLNLKAGEQIKFYFEIADNDSFRGPKKTKTFEDSFEIPTKEKIIQKKDDLANEISNKIQQSLNESRKLEKDVQQLREDLLNKTQIGWQEKKKIEDLIQRKENIQKQLQKAQKMNQEMQKAEQQIDELPPELIKKQEELEKLMDELLSDEMKEMLEELQKMMEKMDPQKMAEMMEKIELKQEEIEENIDRNLEFFKQLEVEKDIQEAADKLEELAKKQEELAQKTENKEKSSEELQKEQEKLNKEFEEWKKEMKEIQEENKKLDNPHSIPGDQEQQENDIQEEMQKASDQLSKSQEQKASGSQKNAAKKMKDNAGMMMQMMQQQQAKQNAEDAALLRQILDNLVESSFRQETIIKGMARTKRQDPSFIDLMKRQNLLRKDVNIVKDSLMALSRRQPSVRKFIVEEVNNIDNKVKKALDKLEDGAISEVNQQQQYAMSSINNLALLISEILDKMDQNKDGQNNSSGNSNCPNSSGKANSPGKMKDLQKQIGDQMKKMQESMKKNGDKPGKKGQKGKKGGKQKKLSEQFARMAAQQAEVRRQMQSYAEELKKQGQKGKNVDEALEEMDQLENDLIHKQITEETLVRQEEILSRLLKEERAELEREKDDKRESKEAEQLDPNRELLFKDFIKKQNQEVELIRTIPAEMRPFFKKKTNEYFFRLNSK
ncbi:MAG: hypothetical protein ACEPOW_11345 [Bacteroidales bacterium]